jgi:hypothetical protein
MDKFQGPNVKKLIIHKMTLLMIPADTPKGQALEAGVRALTTPGNVGVLTKEATAWVEMALALVKRSKHNPYGDDDEAIAGDILRRIGGKKRGTP